MAMGLGTKRPVTDINVTPLIDVVLVLLIIFMVMTPLAEKQMFTRVPEYEPPNQVVPPEQVPPDQTVLTVKADGRVLLNRQDKSIDEAMAYLHEAYNGRPSKVLFFNAEDTVKYDLAVKVLDLAHVAGVNTIGMMTDATAASGTAPAPAAAPAQ
ncbi:MAG TPA: biopolymer transporter ExbD [Anaeromyxobacteraceae bacterium]|jgi:biopolymer transport protein ExbD|nr:biopolymer transporter ExbD [Anaeromyxobacteraceae bacterium]